MFSGFCVCMGVGPIYSSCPGIIFADFRFSIAWVTLLTDLFQKRSCACGRLGPKSWKQPFGASPNGIERWDPVRAVACVQQVGNSPPEPAPMGSKDGVLSGAAGPSDVVGGCIEVGGFRIFVFLGVGPIYIS